MHIEKKKLYTLLRFSRFCRPGRVVLVVGQEKGELFETSAVFPVENRLNRVILGQIEGSKMVVKLSSEVER